jgi:hypothetical protein
VSTDHSFESLDLEFITRATSSVIAGLRDEAKSGETVIVPLSTMKPQPRLVAITEWLRSATQCLKAEVTMELAAGT